MSEANKEGRAAGFYEAPMTACPYRDGTKERHDWESGYTETTQRKEASCHLQKSR